MKKLVFRVNDLIVGLHWPWVEVSGCKPRLIIEDLKKGLPLIGIACEENNFFNLADHWILGIKTKSKVLGKLLGWFNSTFIIPPVTHGYYENSSRYFLQYKDDGVYEGELPENVTKFSLVIFSKRDHWDGKIYSLPTNLRLAVGEDGILRGENEDFRLQPFQLRVSELWPGNSWGPVLVK